MSPIRLVSKCLDILRLTKNVVTQKIEADDLKIIHQYSEYILILLGKVSDQKIDATCVIYFPRGVVDAAVVRVS